MKKNVNNPELLKEFEVLIVSANKVCIPSFSSDYRYQLIKYDMFWAVYCYSSGSRFNISGNHYYYLHELETGEFKGSANSIKGHQIIDQTKLLKKDIERLCGVKR